jgi:transcriptional regulator with XRE-family HTH domain
MFLRLKSRIILKYGTQGRFAQKTGMKESRLSRIISELHAPTDEDIKKLSLLLEPGENITDLTK